MKKQSLPSVAFFIGVFPKISETWFIEQVTSLIDLGLDVQLFAFKRGTSADISEKVSSYRLLERTVYIDEPDNIFSRILFGIINALRLFFFSPKSFVRLLRKGNEDGGFSYVLKYLFWTAPLVGKIMNYPIIHCHFGMIANRYLIIRDILELRQPFVTTFYGQDSSKYIQAKGRHVYDRLQKECAMTFTMTDEMTERFVRMGFPSDRVETHYTGIDVFHYRFAERYYVPGETFKVVFVGRFVEKKGLPDLLRALAIAIKTYPAIEAHIFGGGNESAINAEITDVIQKEHIERHVVFHGMTPNVEVLSCLYKMHLMVQPSKTARNGDTDDLPVALLEAQASGLPVVSTHHVGIPDGVLDGETGFLVPEGDYPALAERILYCIEHPAIISSMSVRARGFMEERFDLIALDKKLIDSYQSILGISRV